MVSSGMDVGMLLRSSFRILFWSLYCLSSVSNCSLLIAFLAFWERRICFSISMLFDVIWSWIAWRCGLLKLIFMKDIFWLLALRRSMFLCTSVVLLVLSLFMRMYFFPRELSK